MKNEPYTCCRCGYSTNQKNSIRRHLYNKQKPCPTGFNDIELTDDIKNHILEYRVYHVQKNESKHVTINNFNTMNNFIANMETMEKLVKYLSYNNMELIDYDRDIETKYQKHAKKLENNLYKDFALGRDDLYDIIDHVSKVKDDNDMNGFNVLYDTKFDELKLYESGTWENILFEKGVKKLIVTIQEYFLDSYELYLVRKIVNSDTNAHQKMKCRELLEEYYRFISVFDCQPYIKGKNDMEILYNIDEDRHDEPCDEYTIEEELLPCFNRISDLHTKSELKKIKTEVFDIIKRNSKKNIHELNKKVINLFSMDENFKKMLLGNIN